MGTPTGNPRRPGSPTGVKFGGDTVGGQEAKEDGGKSPGSRASSSRSLRESTSFYKKPPASQYNSYLESFMDAEAEAVGEPLRDLAASISKLDEEGTPRWATAQGRKVAQKVLQRPGFLDKLVGILPNLRAQLLADAILLLTWVGSSHQQVIISIARNEVLGDITKALEMIDKADPKPNLPPATLSGLLLLQHVIGSRSCLDTLRVDPDTREELMLQLLELGTFKKVVQLHRDGYSRLQNETERTLPIKVLTQLAANVDLAAALHGMAFVVQLLNRLSTTLDDEHALEFLWSISRHELVHRELRTADLLAVVRKIMGGSKISEHSRIRMIHMVAVVYGRRSEAQTFLQTHAVPPDLANVLWIIMTGAEGDLPLSLKMLNELLLGRAGYTTTATARAAAKLLHDQLRILELSGFFEGDDYSEGIDRFTEWMLNSLIEAAGLVEMDHDFSKAVVVLYIIQQAAVMNKTVRHKLVDNKVAIQQLIACIPHTAEAAKAPEAGACSSVAVFLLALLVETAPGQVRRQAVQTLAVVPSMVRRLVTHLEAPGQQYSVMAPALYLLAALVHSLGSTRGTVAAFPHLRPLFHEALAKLLAATIGTKDTALAEQALALMDKLLEHAHQAISEYPDSLACKKLRQWCDHLFEMHAVPKVVMVLGMSPTSKVLRSGTNAISRLIELGYAERVSSALPVIIARCARAPGDHHYSMPILKMAFRREMRGPLRDAGMLNLGREWLATRAEDKQLDLLMMLAFLCSGEEDMNGIGDLLMEYRVTDMVLSVLHSACASYDGHALIVGVKWTAVDALLLLQRLACYERTAGALVKAGGGVSILAMALDKFLRPPPNQQTKTDGGAGGPEGQTNGGVSASPVIQPLDSSRSEDGLAEVVALGDDDDQQGADFFAPADAERTRGRPEALLVTRAILNMLNFDSLLDALHDEELVTVLQEAVNSDDRRLAELALSCLINLEVLSPEHTAVRCFLTSARTLCWAPGKTVQFDVYVSHVPAEASDHAWSLLNALNLRSLRVFMNCRPDDQDLERSLLLTRSIPNFILLMTESTLQDQRCLAELRSAVDAGSTVTIVSVEGVRWKISGANGGHARFVSSPIKAYPNLEDLKTTLSGVHISLSDVNYEDMIEAIAERVKPLSDGWLDRPVEDIMSGDGDSGGADDNYRGGRPLSHRVRRRDATASSSDGEGTAEELHSDAKHRAAGAKPDKALGRPRDRRGPADNIKRGPHQGGKTSASTKRQSSRDRTRGREAAEASAGGRDDRRRQRDKDPDVGKGKRDTRRRHRDDSGDMHRSRNREPADARGESKSRQRHRQRSARKSEAGNSQRPPRRDERPASPPRESSSPTRQEAPVRRSKSAAQETAPRLFARELSLVRSPNHGDSSHESSRQGSPLKVNTRSSSTLKGAIAVPDLLVVEHPDYSSEGSDHDNDEYYASDGWRETQERIEEALEDLPLEVASTVKREVESHVEALQVEFRRQVQAVSSELQSQLQSSLDKVVARQSETQRAVQASMRAMEQQLAKMQERAAEAITAAAAATAKAEDLEARLSAQPGLSASAGRATQLGPVDMESRPEPRGTSSAGEGSEVVFYDVDAEGERVDRLHTANGLDGLSTLSAGPLFPAGDLVALRPVGPASLEGSGFLGVQGSGLVTHSPAAQQHQPPPARGLAKQTSLSGRSSMGSTKALPPQNIFPAVTGSMIRGSHPDGISAAHQPAAVPLPAVYGSPGGAGQQSRTFVNLSGGR